MSVARFGEPFTRTETDRRRSGRRGVRRPVRLRAQPQGQGARRLQQRAHRRAAQGRLGAVSRLHRQQPRDDGRRHRRVARCVHTSPISFQAPNWTTRRQGADLQQRAASCIAFDLATRTPTSINTGIATRNNNDHVLSFDGTMLGISHHSDRRQRPLGRSTRCRSTGGEPKRITPTRRRTSTAGRPTGSG